MSTIRWCRPACRRAVAGEIMLMRGNAVVARQLACRCSSWLKQTSAKGDKSSWEAKNHRRNGICNELLFGVIIVLWYISSKYSEARKARSRALASFYFNIWPRYYTPISPKLCSPCAATARRNDTEEGVTHWAGGVCKAGLSVGISGIRLRIERACGDDVDIDGGSC